MATTAPLFLLSDDELHDRTLECARRERRATLETLAHLEEVQRRRLHLKRGYGSIFDYAVRALGFSESAASERVQAMRVIEAVPETSVLIAAGELTLTSAAAVQRFVRKEEKEGARQRFTLEEKRQLVREVKGLSTRQAQVALLSKSAHPEAHLPKEKERRVSAELTELKFLVDEALMREITRVRELRGGELALAEIFRAALGIYLRKIDPIRRAEELGAKDRAELVRQADVEASEGATRAPESEPGSGLGPCRQEVGREPPGTASVSGAAQAEIKPQRKRALSPKPNPGPHSRSRYVPADVVRTVALRSGGRCEFVDGKSGRRCEARRGLQLDHRLPFARGGEATAQNLRHYCGAHNRLAAIEIFGMAKMGAYLRG